MSYSIKNDNIVTILIPGINSTHFSSYTLCVTNLYYCNNLEKFVILNFTITKYYLYIYGYLIALMTR